MWRGGLGEEVGQKTLRSAHRERDLRHREARVEAHVARHPVGFELLVGAVEPFELEVAVEAAEHRGVEAGDDAGSEAFGIGEDPAQEGEVEGDAADA